MAVETILNGLELSHYTFDKENNIIKTIKSTNYELAELLEIVVLLNDNKIKFIIDDDYNIVLN